MKPILSIIGIVMGTMLIATLMQASAYATDMSNLQDAIQKETSKQANAATTVLGAQLNLNVQVQLNNEQALNIGTCVAVSSC